MRTISTRVSSVFLFVFLWGSIAFMDGNQAQAFLFFRGRSEKPVEEQVEQAQPKEKQEKSPRRRMWQFRRERQQEEQPKQKVVEPTIESTEKPARRRWWSLRRSPRPEPEPKPQVEKPARRRWWSLRRSPRPEPEPKPQVEKPPRRRWWSLRRSPRPEPEPKPQVEKPPRRRWWSLRRSRPEVEPMPQVEKPSRPRDEEVAKKRWWRRSKEKVSTGPAVEPPRDLRYHMLIPDKTLERELLEQFDRRRKNLEQLAMLRAWVAEKNQALNEINKRQFETFSMKPDVLYEYDATNRAIYIVGSMPTRRSGGVISDERKLHLQFVRNEQIQQFVTLNTGKQLVLEQLRVLGLLMAEKQLEGNRIAEAMDSRFAVRNDRNYAYDFFTMRLNELHSAPTPQDSLRPEVLIQVTDRPGTD